MLIDREKQRALLTYFEGRRRSAYQDSKGYWTVGIGRCIDARLNCGLSETEINFLLDNDIERIEHQFIQDYPLFLLLNKPRRAALVDLAFSMGFAALAEFGPTLEHLKNGEFHDAAAHLAASKWARDVGPRRAEPICALIRTGEWPLNIPSLP